MYSSMLTLLYYGKSLPYLPSHSYDSLCLSARHFGLIRLDFKLFLLMLHNLIDTVKIVMRVDFFFVFEFSLDSYYRLVLIDTCSPESVDFEKFCN